MKRVRFSEEQIVGILEEHEAGRKVKLRKNMEVTGILSREEFGRLRRLARVERRRRREEFLSMTPRDVLNILQADLSHRHAQVTSDDDGQDKKVGISLPDDCDVGRYENREEVALILYAKRVGCPLLVKLKTRPSRRFAERLRFSAKIRGCRLHLFRLIDDYVGIEVYSIVPLDWSDTTFLKMLGISCNSSDTVVGSCGCICNRASTALGSAPAPAQEPRLD